MCPNDLTQKASELGLLVALEFCNCLCLRPVNEVIDAPHMHSSTSVVVSNTDHGVGVRWVPLEVCYLHISLYCCEEYLQTLVDTILAIPFEGTYIVAGLRGSIRISHETLIAGQEFAWRSQSFLWQETLKQVSILVKVM